MWRIILCIIALTSLQVQAQTYDQLLDAIKMVESSGDTNAVGDGGKAIGAYQIHKAYWQDAVDFDASLGGKYEDCFNEVYARRVVKAYMRRYAKRFIEAKDWESIARIHNGGPQGYRKQATVKYWEKVKKLL